MKSSKEDRLSLHPALARRKDDPPEAHVVQTSYQEPGTDRVPGTVAEAYKGEKPVGNRYAACCRNAAGVSHWGRFFLTHRFLCGSGKVHPLGSAGDLPFGNGPRLA